MESISSTSSSDPTVWKQGARWWALLVVAVLVLNATLAGALDMLTLRSRARFSLLYARRIPKGAALIIGNSRAVSTFYAPALAELSARPVVNLAYNGMGMRIAEALLQDAVDRNGSPSRVIIEVTAVSGGVELLNDMRLYSRFSTRLRELDTALYPLPAAVSRVFGLYAYNGEMALRVFHYLGHDDQSWVNRHQIKSEAFKDVSRGPNVKLKIDPAELRALQRTIGWLSERGVEYRLVIGPYLPAYLARIQNLAEWQHEIEVACGATITSFADAVTSRHAFADSVHLNEVGSLLLAPQVIRADLL